MTTSSYMPNDDVGKADLLDPLFSFHHAPRGEKKILWIVAPSHVFDPTTLKPSLSIQIRAGHPVILWTKGKASAIEIWVDRNDGNGFVFLTINTEPNTIDTTPLPAPGTSAVWNYKAIYRLHDEQVGQWSDVISITVRG